MRKIMTWAVGPALGLMGIIALLMAAPGLASAGNNVTTASVTVPSSMSFTDETPSITFTPPPALPGEAVNNAQDVTWVSSTNDPNGGSVTVIASGDFTGQQAGDTIPISDLSVNNTPFSESNLQYLEAVYPAVHDNYRDRRVRAPGAGRRARHLYHHADLHSLSGLTPCGHASW